MDPYGTHFNHSFGPNCEIKGREVLALQDIPAGTQLTFDYTTTEEEIVAPFQTKDGRWVGQDRGMHLHQPDPRAKLGNRGMAMGGSQIFSKHGEGGSFGAPSAAFRTSHGGR